MENYDLIHLTISQNQIEEELQYEKASLHIHTEEDQFRSWYIDITSLKNVGFIEKLFNSSDIQITMKAITKEGKQVEGAGFIHPNLSGQNATIRGHDELMGYNELI